jgi:hypothetical protein
MKKVMTIFGAILLASVFFTSCGGGKQADIEIKSKSADVKGDLSDYFTVIEGSYKLVQGEEYTDYSNDPPKGVYNYSVKVQIKRTDKEFDFNAVDLESRGYLSLVCDLFDATGTPVITADREGMRTQGRNSEDKAMVSLKPGESGWAIFAFIGKTEEMKKITTLEVCSNVKMDQAESSNRSSTTSENTESSSSSSVDCDQFIKDYSDFADSYVKLLKKYKANPSDPSILTEYTEAAQKAMEMQKDASSCTDPAYASKLMEIANKIAKAAM